MLRILLQPFPTFSGKAYGLRMSLIAGLCVFGALTLFRPFNLHQVELPELLHLAFVYSLTTIVVSALVVVVLPAILPQIFNDRHWTVLHEIGGYLLLVMLVTLANSVLNIFIYQSHFSLQGFTAMLGMVVSVAVLPVALGVLVKQRRLMKRFELAAMDTGKLLESPHVGLAAKYNTTADNDAIALIGNNRDERIEVQPGDLLLITASDNYVEIYYLERGKVQSRLFRNTLKAIQERLTNHPEFFRAHKTHLVNLKKVVKVTGNAQGLKLYLAAIPEPVPVSRNLTSDVKEKLASVQ